MRKDVQYRDLPGGPLMVKFADELPLCTLCSKCGMLSKDMFEDPSSHAFCSVCIFECSDRKKIHCKYENKDVSVDEMMPAIDILNIVMDQVVYCPSAKDGDSCSEHCALKDLEEHILKCEKTEVICLSCGDAVKGVDWQGHVTSCPQQILQCRHCVVAVPRWRLEQHERVCSSNPNAVREVESCPATTVDSNARSYSDSDPNHEGLSVSGSRNNHRKMPGAMVKVRANTEVVYTNTPCAVSNVDDVAIQSCPLCKRNVKRINMPKHFNICQQRMPRPDSPGASRTPGMVVARLTKETVPTKELAQQYPENPHQDYNRPELHNVPMPPGQRPDEHALALGSWEDLGITAPIQHYPQPQRQAYPSTVPAMQLYPQLPRAHCPPQLPIAPIGSGGHPDDHALSNQGILPSAPVHAVFQCPESGGLRFEVNHFGQDQRHRDQYAPHTSYGPASRSAIQAVHSQQRDIAWSASSMVHCPPRQQHEELDEVATPASEHYDLSSDFEHVSIPHALPPQHFKELDQYVGLLQRGAYSQPPASGVAETEPSRLEQAPVRHGIREETHHLTESAEQKDSSIQHAEARRDSSNIPEKTPKSCFPFWSKKFKGIRRMAKRFFCL